MNSTINDQELFKSAAGINISYIKSFYHFINNELQIKEDELNQAIDTFHGSGEEKIELTVERDVYSKTFKRNLMSVTFLLLYSHLEEWLYLIWKYFDKTIPLAGNRGSISRFKPILQQIMQFDLSQDTDWQFILEAEKIRNCLLHANARIDLSKDSSSLKKLLTKYSEDLFENNSRLILRPTFLDKFFTCIHNIIKEVPMSRPFINETGIPSK